jgi:hypothetical protein
MNEKQFNHGESRGIKVIENHHVFNYFPCESLPSSILRRGRPVVKISFYIGLINFKNRSGE